MWKNYLQIVKIVVEFRYYKFCKMINIARYSIMDTNLAKCPKCGSASLNSAGRGLRGKRQRTTCLNCGYQYDPTHKRRMDKQKKVLLIAFIIFVVILAILAINKGLGNFDTDSVGQTSNIEDKLSKMSGLNEEVTVTILGTLKKCGVSSLISLEHDELLDGLYEDTVGYRAKSDDYNNICIYLKNDAVYRINYLNVALYTSGKPTALIKNVNEFTFSIKPEDSNSNKKFIEQLNTFTKNTDEVENLNFYQPSSSTKFSNQMGLNIYISNKDDKYTFRLRVQYAGESWVFCNQYVVNTDGKKNIISPKKVLSDNNHEVWEYSDDIIDFETMPVLRKIAKSEKAILRYQGNEKYFDRDITQEEKDGLKEMIKLYDMALLTK